MSVAHVIALALLPVAVLITTAIAFLSRRGRDVIFFTMVAGMLVAERFEVNFFSEAWYRGTTRGILVSAFEILALALLIGCRFGRRDESRKLFWPASLALMVLYTAYAGLSVVASTPKLFGAFELSKMVGAILFFLAAAAYIRGKREWRILIVALACAVGTEGLWAIKQKVLTHLDRAQGSLDHANSLSTYFCMMAPILIAVTLAEWPRWLRWLCGIAAVLAGLGEILTFSRMGIPLFMLLSVATIALAGRIRLTRSTVAIGVFLISAFVIVIGASWNVIRARYAEASLQEEYFDVNVDGRGIYLRLAANMVGDHPFGVGLNNWSLFVSRSYGPDLGFKFASYDWLLGVYGKDKDVFADSYLAAPAHNLMALTLGELGYPGLILFGLLWLRWFSIPLPFLWASACSSACGVCSAAASRSGSTARLR